MVKRKRKKAKTTFKVKKGVSRHTGNDIYMYFVASGSKTIVEKIARADMKKKGLMKSVIDIPFRRQGKHWGEIYFEVITRRRRRRAGRPLSDITGLAMAGMQAGVTLGIGKATMRMLD